MLIVKLHVGSNIEFETREELEAFIQHTHNEVDAYGLLLDDPDSDPDFLEWCGDQKYRAEAKLFCARQCQEDFDLLEETLQHRQAKEATQ